MRYLLDTHVWIWWNAAPEKLSKKAAALLARKSADDELLLSAISVWEFAMLAAKGRIEIAIPTAEWVDAALSMPRLRLVPLSPGIACASAALPSPMHGDPADRIIVASAMAEKAVLVTCDGRIADYPALATLWK